MKPSRGIASAKDDLSAMPTEAAPGRRLCALCPSRERSTTTPRCWGASAMPLFSRSSLGTMTIRSGVVYVLHVFQKKSKRGIPTPTAERTDIGR